MKIILATCGSRGDVQPMIALALGLKSAGHDVRLIGPPEKKAWADHLGCPYQSLGQDITAFIDGMNNVVDVRSLMACMAFIRQELETQFKALPDLVGSADLIIGSSLVFALSSVAEKHGIPYRYVLFTMNLLPSGDHPFILVKPQTLPRWCNRLTWRLAAFCDRFNITRLINRHRIQWGLPPLANGWDHIMGPHPVAVCDPAVARVPEDVTVNVTQTGYLHLELPVPEHPTLERFIESGHPPVYAGFGSMPPRDQARLIPILVGAARNLNRRIIILKFWSSPSEFQQQDDVFFIRHYPHTALFPRTAAVIHHGGAGTTAVAARSGVPQVIVPHLLDQYFHGQRIFEERLGPRPIHRSRLTEKLLTAALDTCLNNSGIRSAVLESSRTINPELALKKTVEALENSV